MPSKLPPQGCIDGKGFIALVAGELAQFIDQACQWQWKLHLIGQIQSPFQLIAAANSAANTFDTSRTVKNPLGQFRKPTLAHPRI